MTAIEADLARALEANGITATAPDGMHSWRCEYPDRYGPCDCLAGLSMSDLAAVLAPLLDQARAQAWDEGYEQAHADAEGGWYDEPQSRNNPYRAAALNTKENS